MSLEGTMPLSIILLLRFAKVWKVLENGRAILKTSWKQTLSWKVFGNLPNVLKSTWIWLFLIYLHCKNWSVLKKISKQRCGYLDEKSIRGHLSLSGDSSCFCGTFEKFIWVFTLSPHYRNHLIQFVTVCPTVTKVVLTTSQKLLVWFHPNFTGMISVKCSCAYNQHFTVHWFLSELWPFNDFYGWMIFGWVMARK